MKPMCLTTFVSIFSYDVRGHLYSEADFGLRKNESDVDQEEERLRESLDRERYMFLTIDELEFEAYLGKFRSIGP